MLIVKMICLAIGTVLAVLFILLTMRGKKEDWRIEGVPEKEFSDKELWAAGFAMQQMPMFSMDSAVGKKMISASAILHPENGGRFVEYWAPVLGTNLINVPAGAGFGILRRCIHGWLYAVCCAGGRCCHGGSYLFQRRK